MISHDTIGISPDPQTGIPAGGTREKDRTVRKPLGARDKKSAARTPEFSPLHDLNLVHNGQGHNVGRWERLAPPAKTSSSRTETSPSQANTHTSKDTRIGSPSLTVASDRRRENDDGGHIKGDRDGLQKGMHQSQFHDATVSKPHHIDISNNNTSKAGLKGGLGLRKLELVDRLSKRPDQTVNATQEIPRNDIVVPGSIDPDRPADVNAALGILVHENSSYTKFFISPPENQGRQNSSGERNGEKSWGIELVSEDDVESSDESSDEIGGTMVPASVWEGAPAWDLTLVQSTDRQNVDWEVPLDYRHAPELAWGVLGGKSKIEWYFAPDKDERVSSLLIWIEIMADRLGVFGLCKFLRCKQRGALFTYADCRSERNPELPAFDWIGFDDLHQTDDRFIRDSVSYYHPARQVVIFIILPSMTGDQFLMWRRTIDIPSKVRLMFDREIKLVMNRLWDQEAESAEEGRAISERSANKKIPGRRRHRPVQKRNYIGLGKTSPPQLLNASTNNVTSCQSSVYRCLSDLLRQEIAASRPGKPLDRIQKALQTASDTSASLNNLPALQLSRSYQYRAQLMEICLDLGIVDNPTVRKALKDDEKQISLILQRMIGTKDFGRKAILRLQKKDAESFADLLQMTLDRFQKENPNFWRGARRLLVKLSEISGVIPKSLTIHGISLLEKEAIFGGGFADIYRASYKNQEVAVKRMRVFQRGQDRHKIHRTFCKEALLWRSFQHPHVLPFLGVDSKTFSPYLCMVSPWMQHGTIMRHLSENEGIDVNKLLREVTQGLYYLHSQKVVHGDLRGSNILINDEWQACLADFGLTVVSDATLGTQTSNSHGSVRWMAPELHDPESFGFTRFVRTLASDIYAFGCVCFEVYTGRAPFADIVNDSAVMLQVLRGIRPRRPNPGTGRRIPSDVWYLIEECWRQTPSERLDIHDVVDVTEDWG